MGMQYRAQLTGNYQNCEYFQFVLMFADPLCPWNANFIHFLHPCLILVTKRMFVALLFVISILLLYL